MIHSVYKEYSAKDLARAFKKINHKEKFDIVHANNVEPTMALKYIPNRITKTVHLRDYHVFGHMFMADSYIAINKRMEIMAKEHRLKNVWLIHDPIEDYKISELTKEEARKLLNLYYNNICLFVGHFMWQTDPSIMLEMAKEMPDIDFVLCGDGPIKLNTKLKNVHFKGKIASDEISAYYKAADLFFYPSVVDMGYGLTVIESLANGTPVIAYDKEGIDEIIKKDVNGFITTQEKIIEDVKVLFKNKKLLEIMGKNAEMLDGFKKDEVLAQVKNFFTIVAT